jgi:hypothetical protein
MLTISKNKIAPLRPLDQCVEDMDPFLVGSVSRPLGAEYDSRSWSEAVRNLVYGYIWKSFLR